MPPGLFLAGKAALDQAGNNGAGAERAFHQSRFLQPVLQIVAEHVLGKQVVKRDQAIARLRADIAAEPDRQRIVIGDKAERFQVGPLHAAGQKHAQRLVREAALKRIGDEIIFAAAWKCLHKQVARRRQARMQPLQVQPVAHLGWQAVPLRRVRQQVPHTRRQMRRERKFAAGIGGHLWRVAAGAADNRLTLDNAAQAQDLAAKQECIARRQRFQKIFLDFAQNPAAAPDHAGIGAGRHRAALQPDLQQVGFDNRANVHAIVLGDFWIGDAPQAIGALPDFGKTIIAFQRIAAIGDEMQRAFEIGARQRRIGCRRRDLAKQDIGRKRPGAGHAEDMLGQHVQRAGAGWRRVLHPSHGGIDCGAAFQHLEAVGWHQQRL